MRRMMELLYQFCSVGYPTISTLPTTLFLLESICTRLVHGRSLLCHPTLGSQQLGHDVVCTAAHGEVVRGLGMSKQSHALSRYQKEYNRA